MTRTYVTQNSQYPVDHLDSRNREVILGSDGRPYAIIGFADPEKLETFILGTDGYWIEKSSGKQLGRENGELEEKLEKTPKPGLKVVAWLLEDKGNQVGPGSGQRDEMVTSELVEIKE